MAALSAPLALLLTLRANASLGRLNEARQTWGKLILRGRNLAALLRVYVLPYHPSEAVLAARYLSVLGWSIKAYVRNESYQTQRQVYKIMLGSQETQWLLSQEALPPPLAILLRVRQIVADVSLTNNNPNFFVPHTAMDKAIDDLDSVLGTCQRLLTSPIPPTYSRHLSRIMVMYLFLLPFALVAGGTPSMGTAVASALVSYVIIGIDEIGMEMENPFPLLPLQQLSSNLQNVVGQQLLV
jgi:putative membrane protein